MNDMPPAFRRLPSIVYVPKIKTDKQRSVANQVNHIAVREIDENIRYTNFLHKLARPSDF